MVLSSEEKGRRIAAGIQAKKTSTQKVGRRPTRIAQRVKRSVSRRGNLTIPTDGMRKRLFDMKVPTDSMPMQNDTNFGREM